MTRLYSGTASVVNGGTTVTVTGGDPLSSANCPADAGVVLGALSGYVASRTSTTVFDLVAPYLGATGSVALTIDPLTPDALSVINLAVMAARVQAQLNVLDKNSQGLFFTRLGVTGAADPGPGYVAFDDAVPADITAFYIDPIDGNERTVAGLINQWTVGTVLVVRSLATTAYVALELTANTGNEGGWFSGDVRFVESDGVIADGEQVAIGWFRIGNGLAFDESGSFADRDDFDAEAGGFVYLSNDGDGGSLSGGALFVKASATSGDWGPAIPLQGAPGAKGWAPKFAVVTDGARRVLQLTGYVGGEGTEPTSNVGQYAGSGGYTPVLASGSDIRGSAGTNGSAATIEVGTVSALPSGSTPTVNNAGTSSAAVLNFGLPVPDDGTDGVDGVDGVDGTDPGILLIWDEDNADSNQGAGKIWSSHDALGSATTLYVSKTNRASDDISSFLATIDASSNPSRKGTIVLTRSGGNAQATFDVSALTDATGYVKLTVINPSGALGFLTNDLISLQFTPAGDQGASGPGTGDVVGPGSSVAHRIAAFSDTSGTALEDTGKLTSDFVEKANNGSDFANKQTTLDNLSLQGADIASNATINLETATGSFVDVTGTTATSAITLADGHRRRVRAAGAWPITVGASLVLNNGGSSYTCAAGDTIEFVADGTVIRGTVHPISGIMPGVNAAIAAYVAAQDVEVFKGFIDCSANPNYPAADAGHVYRVSVAGKIGGASGVTVEVNDRLECVVDSTASGNHATVGANWMVTQTNLEAGSVSNTLLANMANGTTKARVTAGAGAPEDVTLPLGPPQGRLTLTSAVPVTTADVTGATSIYYTPAAGSQAPIYNGATLVPTNFSELTLALDSDSGHTGYHQSGKNFDLFLINDSGTLRLATGPAWSSDTARGTGAGTTELELKNGIWTNKVSITARFGSSSGNAVSVAANLATYLGTFRASANGQASDTLLKRFLWNAYNQAVRTLKATDATSSWAWSTAAIRQANANTANKVEFVFGLSGVEVEALAISNLNNSTATARFVGVVIGLDSVTAGSNTIASNNQAAAPIVALYATYEGYPGLGYHYIAWLEIGAGADTQTWYGAGAGLKGKFFG